MRYKIAERCSRCDTKFGKSREHFLMRHRICKHTGEAANAIQNCGKMQPMRHKIWEVEGTFSNATQNLQAHWRGCQCDTKLRKDAADATQNLGSRGNIF